MDLNSYRLHMDQKLRMQQASFDLINMMTIVSKWLGALKLRQQLMHMTGKLRHSDLLAGLKWKCVLLFRYGTLPPGAPEPYAAEPLDLTPCPKCGRQFTEPVSSLLLSPFSS